MRDTLPYLLVYAWFIVVGKVTWWIDLTFARYNGPSEYLEFCTTLGIFALFVMGMLPAAVVIRARHRPPRWKGDWRDTATVIGEAAAMTIACFFATALLSLVGVVISWVSDDAAIAFIRVATVNRP